MQPILLLLAAAQTTRHDCGGYANCPEPTGPGHYEVHAGWSGEHPVPDAPEGGVVKDVPDGFGNGFVTDQVPGHRYVLKYEWKQYDATNTGDFGERICVNVTLAYSKGVELGRTDEGGFGAELAGISVGVSVSRTVTQTQGKEVGFTYSSSAGATCDVAYRLKLFLLQARLVRQDGTYPDPNDMTKFQATSETVVDAGYKSGEHKFLKESRSRRWVADPVTPPVDPHGPHKPDVDEKENEDVIQQRRMATPQASPARYAAVWSLVDVSLGDSDALESDVADHTLLSRS